MKRLRTAINKHFESSLKAAGGLVPGPKSEDDTEYYAREYHAFSRTLYRNMARWLGLFAENPGVLEQALVVFMANKETKWRKLRPDTRMVIYPLACLAGSFCSAIGIDSTCSLDLISLYNDPTTPPIEHCRILIGLAYCRQFERVGLSFITQELRRYGMLQYYLTRVMQSRSFVGELLAFVGNCIEPQDPDSYVCAYSTKSGE